MSVFRIPITLSGEQALVLSSALAAQLARREPSVDDVELLNALSDVVNLMPPKPDSPIAGAAVRREDGRCAVCLYDPKTKYETDFAFGRGVAVGIHKERSRIIEREGCVKDGILVLKGGVPDGISV